MSLCPNMVLSLYVSGPGGMGDYGEPDRQRVEEGQRHITDYFN